MTGKILIYWQNFTRPHHYKHHSFTGSSLKIPGFFEQKIYHSAKLHQEGILKGLLYVVVQNIHKCTLFDGTLEQYRGEFFRLFYVVETSGLDLRSRNAIGKALLPRPIVFEHLRFLTRG